MSAIIAILLVTIAVVAIVVGVMAKRLLYVSAPNQALVFSGPTHTSPDGHAVGYKVIRGGRRILRPLVERVDSVDLNNISIDIEVLGAFSKGGIPLNVHGIANVKLPGNEPDIYNAIERFLGREVDYIRRIAKETLEGNVRGVLALLTPEEVNEDKNRFAQNLVDEAEHDMKRMGLVLDTLKIQNVTDDAGYLNSIGRIRGASVRMNAVIAEANAKADADVQAAQNWSASETAKIEADLIIAQQETQKRILDAQTKREAMILEAQNQVAAQIAQARAEIDKQKARAPQVKRQLDADIIQPAEADRRSKEEAARGAAATVVERGKAEAAGLKLLVEAYRSSGPSGKDVLALQKLLPLIADVAGVRQKLRLTKVSVLPHAGDGDAIARATIGATTQLDAAGVDLTGLARRVLGGAPQDKGAAPAPPPPPRPASK